MKKALTALMITLIFTFHVIPAYCSSDIPLDIEAAAYILMDAKTGSVLYEYQPDLKWRPASTTKIMTALVALKKGDMNQLMTASKEAVSDIGVGGMNIGIMPGEQMTLNDLMHANLIASANESSNIIAENLFPTREEFVTEMNSLAIMVGAKNTTFTNPCGIDEYEKDAEHFSTARDLALIAKECLTYEAFKEIVIQPKLDMLSPTNKHDKWNVLPNTNKMLGKSYKYGPDTGDDRNQFTVTGMKTGSTMRAGANFISAAVNKEGLELISVILGVNNKPGRTVFDFTETLLRAGYENFSKQMVVDRNTKIQTVEVQDASDDGHLDLVTNGKIEAILPNDKNDWKIEEEITIHPDIKAPVKKGDHLGSIVYKKGDIIIGTVDIISSRTVDQNFKAKARDFVSEAVKTKTFKYILTAVIVILVFLLLRVILRKISRKRRYRRRRYRRNY